jgi:hypothetical protein
MKGNTMAESKFNEAVLQWVESLRETNQAITEGAVAAQERNMRYAQTTFESGIEVLKSYAEDTRSLLNEVVEQPHKPQETSQLVVDKVVAAQERGIRYAQSILENGSEVWKSQEEGTRALTQTLSEQSKKQQGALQALFQETSNAYLDFWRAPFTYYQQAVNAVESIAWQNIDTARKVTREGFNVAEQATREGFDTMQESIHQG